ncbi:hypothetical protein ACWD6L_21530 [Micromonospora profundi]
MLQALSQASGAVDDCASASLWALSDAELLASLDAAHGASQRLAAVELGLVRELDARGLALTEGATSTAVWLRDRLRLSGRSASSFSSLPLSTPRRQQSATPCMPAPSVSSRAASWQRPSPLFRSRLPRRSPTRPPIC